MTSRRWRLAHWAWCLVLAAGLACSTDESPTGASAGLEALTVEAVGQTSIRLRWPAATDPAVRSYRVSRRVNLDGAYAALADVSRGSGSEEIYFDTTVQPETWYGYQVAGLSQTGEELGFTVVAGAQTPPPQGVDVHVSTSYPDLASADSDGYFVDLVGPDTAGGSLGLQQRRRFNPLAPGAYSVVLRGVQSNCLLQGDSVRAASVTELGLQTITEVGFAVECRDPTRGRITVAAMTGGDSLDLDGYHLTLTGIAADASLPDSARLITRTANMPTNGTQLFDGLRPGEYETEISGIAGNCTLQGAALRRVDVAALGDATVDYRLSCTSAPVDTTGRPFPWSNNWSAAAAAVGTTVTLTLTLDLTSDPLANVSAVQAGLDYDPAILRYDSIAPGRLNNIVDNGATSGRVTWGAFTTAAGGRTGDVKVADMYFTVVGGAGQSTTTRTLNVQANNAAAVRFDTLIYVREAVLSITAGTPNQAPTAAVNGPYVGTAGVPVALSAAGSADPDGAIVSYAWTFGDGTTGTGASPSKTWTNAGSYPVELTVTDDKGATGTAQTTATVSAGGGNQPPHAEANGPYSGGTGVSIGFSAAGSTDPDGSIVSYSWAFGDGTSGSGASPIKTYAVAGTYTAVLTVTDNLGATATDQAAVTVGDGGSSPFPFSGSWGVINPVDNTVPLTITLDLTTDIPETPGIEQIQTWLIDSLRWNPAVLQFFSFNFGNQVSGFNNQTFVSQGRLLGIGGTHSLSSNSTGVVTIAVIRFKVVGATGGQTTTATSLGTVRGSPATGSYDYLPLVGVQEATFVVP
jgi:PKD repeat protein